MSNHPFLTIRYQLLVVQQPGLVSSTPGLFSSTSFHSKLTRRVVSPCPIFQLVKKTTDGQIISDLSQLGNVCLMVAHLSLLSNEDEDLSIITNRSNSTNILYERILEGSTVSNCYCLTDIYGKKGAYFVFEELSIKMEGVFKLQAIVNDISEYIYFFKL
jgi:hypothetical protein